MFPNCWLIPEGTAHHEKIVRPSSTPVRAKLLFVNFAQPWKIIYFLNHHKSSAIHGPSSTATLEKPIMWVKQ